MTENNKNLDTNFQTRKEIDDQLNSIQEFLTSFEEYKERQSEIDSELRKSYLSSLNNDKELNYLHRKEKRVITINDFTNKIGTVNKKAIEKLKASQLSSTQNKEEEFENISDEMDASVEEKKKQRSFLEVNNDRPIFLGIVQQIHCGKNFLIDLPTVLLGKLKQSDEQLIDMVTTFEPTLDEDTLFALEKETMVEEGMGRKRTMVGSITSSILVLITTLTIGIIVATLLINR